MIREYIIKYGVIPTEISPLSENMIYLGFEGDNGLIRLWTDGEKLGHWQAAFGDIYRLDNGVVKGIYYREEGTELEVLLKDLNRVNENITPKP